ncbi:MAG: hypothetical protein J6Z40_12670 [Oscillospiraceae bacterium]|nr:hypothetical protein [Oscillospiraceae bacterium]
MELRIRVRQLHAEPESEGLYGVCGNSGDTVRFDFDEEWALYPEKTAIVVFASETGRCVTEIPFSGDCCVLPPVERTSLVRIGVSAGDIRTAAFARIPYAACITDIIAEEMYPQADIYDRLLAELMHSGTQDICRGGYLVTADGNYLATAAGDYLMTKE